MKKKLIYVHLFSIILHANASTYYISANGNDTNKGTSTSAPFKTIDRINELLLKPGDSVLFRRGEIFRGQLKISESGTSNNPIVISAYSYGAKPIINGSEVVSHWINIGNNIWQTSCPLCGTEMNGLYSNSIALPLGRWPNLDKPNEGYNTILSHSGDTSIITEESLTTDWVGADIVLRNEEWILDKSNIKSQHGSNLTFSPSKYEPRNNWGYFIQNHRATLDENGEWYYNPITKIINIYCNPPNIDTINIEATIYPIGINITGSFITILNIHVEKTLYCGILATNILNLTVKNTTILNSGNNGIEIKGTVKDIDLEDDTIASINNDGILVTNCTGFICKNNFLKNIALLPGRGNSGDGEYVAIKFTSQIIRPQDTSFIENNRIDSVGYIGIDFQSSNIIIKNNIISNFDLVKDDGGGIYSYNGTKKNYINQYIISNIISNATDNLFGVYSTPYHGANGIYLDSYVQNIEMKNNIVFNCVGGLMLHATNNISIIGNTFFNNGTVNNDHGALQIAPVEKCDNSYNTLKNNIFFSKYVYQGVAWEYTQAPDYSQFGISDSNYFCRPFDDLPIFYIRKGSNYFTIPLSIWRLISGNDINSKSSPTTYKPYVVNNYIGPNIFSENSLGDPPIWVSWSDSNNHRFIWDSTNGGSMELSFIHNVNSPLSAMYAGILFSPAVSSNETYILHFDAVSQVDTVLLTCQLTGGKLGYPILSNTAEVLIGSKKRKYEVCLVVNKDDSSVKSRFYFKLLKGNGTIYISNISMKQANVTYRNPNDSILFFYNDTQFNKKYMLPIRKNYIDVKKNKYSSWLQLTPFTSIILLEVP